jgi:hypothetical protein
MNIKGVIHFTDTQYNHLGWQVKQALKGDILPAHLEILMKGVKDPKPVEESYSYAIPLLNMIRFMEAFTGKEYEPYNPDKQ